MIHFFLFISLFLFNIKTTNFNLANFTTPSLNIPSSNKNQKSFLSKYWQESILTAVASTLLTLVIIKKRKESNTNNQSSDLSKKTKDKSNIFNDQNSLPNEQKPTIEIKEENFNKLFEALKQNRLSPDEKIVFFENIPVWQDKTGHSNIVSHFIKIIEEKDISTEDKEFFLYTIYKSLTEAFRGIGITNLDDNLLKKIGSGIQEYLKNKKSNIENMGIEPLTFLEYSLEKKDIELLINKKFLQI